MRKVNLLIVVIFLAFIFSACGTDTKSTTNGEATEAENTETVQITETEEVAETTEPEVLPEPEWLSDEIIDEACTYIFSLEREKDAGMAQELLLPLVESGNTEAIYYWGYIYDFETVDNNGEGEKEALYWLKIAAEQGFAKACLAVALNEYIGSEDEAKEYIDAATQLGVFEMSAEELKADGCTYMAFFYQSKGDIRTAMDWYGKAAEMGSTTAMSEIGYMHYTGQGASRDYQKALEWYLKAANLGDANAMNMYGFILCQREVASKLIKEGLYSTELEITNEAVDWFEEAAALGHSMAMNNIGFYNYESYGINEKAWSWYERAAKEGNTVAMMNLGNSYHNEGKRKVDGQDYWNKAVKWLIKAYANDADGASGGLNYMLSRKRGVNAYFENYAELVFGNLY